jgi:hypothetical protein
MTKKVDPHAEIQRILVNAAQADPRVAARYQRIWDAVSSATFASNVHPIEHVLSIVILLEDAGCSVLERRTRDRLLTVRSACARVG